MAKEDGGPAFPLPAHEVIYGPGMANLRVSAEYGMSLRDWFAGMALQGMFSDGSNAVTDFNPDWEGYKGGIPEEYAEAAKLAYLAADAMLKERNK